MIESFSGLLASLRQTSPVVFLGLSIATGLILFSGDSFITTLGLETFRSDAKGYLGAAFVVSTSILISQIAFGLFQVGKTQFKKQQKRKAKEETLRQKQEQLHNLTPDEKAYLSPYVINNENTQYFLIEDGVAGGLVAKGFIYRSSQVGSIIDGWAYNIQPWVKGYLRDNPVHLEGANPNPSGPPRW